MTKDLSGQIVEIAHARRRFGYRRIHDLLRPDFPGGVGDKRMNMQAMKSVRAVLVRSAQSSGVIVG